MRDVVPPVICHGNFGGFFQLFFLLCLLVSQWVGWSVDPSFCRYFEVHRQFLQHCPVPLPKCLLTCRTQEEFRYLKPKIIPPSPQISPFRLLLALWILKTTPSNFKLALAGFKLVLSLISALCLSTHPPLLGLNSQVSNDPLSLPISPGMPQISPLKPHIRPLRIRTPPFHLFWALPI